MTQHVEATRSEIMSELGRTASTKLALCWPHRKLAELILDIGGGRSRFMLVVDCAWAKAILVDVAADRTTFEGADPRSRPTAVHRSRPFADRVFHKKPSNHGPGPSELQGG